MGKSKDDPGRAQSFFSSLYFEKLWEGNLPAAKVDNTKSDLRRRQWLYIPTEIIPTISQFKKSILWRVSSQTLSWSDPPTWIDVREGRNKESPHSPNLVLHCVPGVWRTKRDAARMHIMGDSGSSTSPGRQLKSGI